MHRCSESVARTDKSVHGGISGRGYDNHVTPFKPCHAGRAKAALAEKAFETRFPLMVSVAPKCKPPARTHPDGVVRAPCQMRGGRRRHRRILRETKQRPPTEAPGTSKSIRAGVACRITEHRGQAVAHRRCRNEAEFGFQLRNRTDPVSTRRRTTVEFE